jgi:DNA-binding LytR/AlgR family response regulator
MTAIAIDDEPMALEVIKSHAAKVPFLELTACFTNAFEGIDYMQKHGTDLVFLDIKMPDITGIEISRSLPREVMIIFTTAYSEHAVEGFEVDAVDYLLKPFSLARFLKACSRAQELFLLKKGGSEPGSYLFLKDGYEQVKVMLEDILYIEAAGNYLNVFVESGRITTRQTLNDMEAILPRDKFIRIHRSYIVAKSKVTRFSRQSVYIREVELPVGNNYKFLA